MNIKDLDKPFEESESVEEEIISEGNGEEGTPAITEEESKVPYSRFKKFHDRATSAEEKAKMWKERAELLEAEGKQFQPKEESTDVPEWWLTLYGNNDDTRKGWGIYQKEQQKQLGGMRDQLRQEAIQAIREEQQQEVTRINRNLETIDDGIDALSDLVGRELNDTEQSAVLDIVDEFTPKDEGGNYLGSIMSFEKAWEVYEMREKVNGSGRRENRNRIAGLSGSQSQGQPSAQAEEDKNFVPGAWGSWRNKLRG